MLSKGDSGKEVISNPRGCLLDVEGSPYFLVGIIACGKSLFKPALYLTIILLRDHEWEMWGRSRVEDPEKKKAQQEKKKKR